MAVDLDPVKDGGATARSKQTGGAAAGESDRKAAANPFDQFDAPEQVAAAAESDRKAAAGAAGARELTALAMKGNAEAAFLLGVMYAEGDGVAKDSAKAVSYFRQASEKNHRRAQFCLGVFLFNGVGVNQSRKEAAEQWFSAAMGDFEPALFWLRFSAEQGERQHKLHSLCSSVKVGASRRTVLRR